MTHTIGGALRVLRLSSIVDGAYDLLARYRKNLGRFVPDGPAPRRYP
jgi:hypothetical protein